MKAFWDLGDYWLRPSELFARAYAQYSVSEHDPLDVEEDLKKL